MMDEDDLRETREQELIVALRQEVVRLATETDGPLRRISVHLEDASLEVEWARRFAEMSLPASPDVRTELTSTPEGAHEDHNIDAPGPSECVISPMVGTFYHAPEPGAPTFVDVGDVIDRDTVVGIVEAMKLMNPITADLEGVVHSILVPDGTPVEYGQPLITITSPDHIS